MVIASTNETALAKVTGRSWTKMPYISHNKIPVEKIINVVKEISFASFIFQIFIAWGKKAIVVQVAATNPNTVIQFIKSPQKFLIHIM